MYILKIVLSCVVAYLFGNLLTAVLLGRIFLKDKITERGNNNPGASNVYRNAGKFAGLLCFLGDGLKGVIPVFLAGIFFFNSGSFIDSLVLYLIGISAIIGHCRPLWNNHKGGKGMATYLGLALYFFPVELAITYILAFIYVMVFSKHTQEKRGRWIPTYTATAITFFVAALKLIFDINWCWHFGLGGHNWGTILGLFLASLTMLIINRSPFVDKNKKA